MRRREERSRLGQSMVETMTAFFVLIPIALAALDIATLFTASQQNEQLAETAARAAADMHDSQSAKDAVADAIEHSGTNSIVRSISSENLRFDQAKGVVSLTMVSVVKVPVPLPYLSEVTCRASVIEPIVSTPAER